MQENLRKQKEINMKLRKEIRQRIGEGLDDLTFEELRGLEQDLDGSIKVVRDRKLRNLQETHTHLVREFEARGEDPYYEADYESLLGMPNGGGHLLPYRLQPSQPNLQDGDGYGSYNLRLG
uniref:MADS transcription factor AP3-3 n=1 Tax=Nigella integrifolia TaxID=2982723 RepID=A0A977THZ0_9MAGN|nr:MADS transcription factor AP3-3 [Nigella integrifolia]